MRILPFSSNVHTNRAPALLGTCCLALVVSLSGCASKNPLIDSPANVAKANPATPATQPKVATEIKPTTTAADSTTQVAAPTGLKRALWFISPYRFNIQQGNFISQEAAAQIKEGMTREQVRFVLGTALINDIFHADRWDYLFRLQKGNGELTTSRLTIFFKEGKVVRSEGGNLPTEQEYITRIAGPVIEKK